MYAEIWWGNLKGRNYIKDASIFERILKK